MIKELGILVGSILFCVGVAIGYVFFLSVMLPLNFIVDKTKRFI